jgi:hypothetical protein
VIICNCKQSHYSDHIICEMMILNDLATSTFCQCVAMVWKVLIHKTDSCISNHLGDTYTIYLLQHDHDSPIEINRICIFIQEFPLTYFYIFTSWRCIKNIFLFLWFCVCFESNLIDLYQHCQWKLISLSICLQNSNRYGKKARNTLYGKQEQIYGSKISCE